MDFYTVAIREGKKGEPPEIFPDFTIGRSKDLMVRAKSFYAIWDEEAGMWSTDEYDVQRLVDENLRRFAEAEREKGNEYVVKYLRSAANGGWYAFRKYMQNVSDNSHPLDENLTFANTQVRKSDYVSRRLAYALEEGSIEAWDELVGTLYVPEQREKIEYHIGAVVAGEAKKMQKFVVFYGPGGKGKSTIMNIIAKMFEGYTTTFEAKALVSNNGAFATEVFRNNPLVAIQQDGDLSQMEDNSKFNSIVSHEDMTMNEKYKPSYTAKVNAFLFMGTNKPVRISDAKSGIIRRLIDIHPSGNLFAPNHYHSLMAKVEFELGPIAYHCLQVYRSLGKNYYNHYLPLEMMFQTDIFFNFVEAHYDIFREQNGTTVKQAFALYREYCSSTGIEKPLPQYKMRTELQNYFEEFHERATLQDGTQVRSYYHGFIGGKFKTTVESVKGEEKTFSLDLGEDTSLFDLEFAEQPAQSFRLNEFNKEVPAYRWANVKTTLADINTRELHYVKIPEQHIVIDFDLKDESGDKSLELNLAEASKWPPTYAELSQGGNGVHLHYTYDGDVTELAALYDEGIEVKTLLGDASLRRRLTKCNNVPVAVMKPGPLPVKEKKKVLDQKTVQNERHLRALVTKALRKEVNAGTKSNIDFIYHVLEEAYRSGIPYDLTEMRSTIFVFANGSSNQPLECLKLVQKMKFKASEDIVIEPAAPVAHPALFQKDYKDEGKIAFYDVEVYPNLFIVCWKYQGSNSIIKMINPSPSDIEGLLRLKLVGFYNRRYDNHIMYARYMGYSLEKLYNLSQKLVSGVTSVMFAEAYGLSYADIYDFSSKKQGLKKFMIELGIHKMEMDIPWDEPVPESLWQRVVDYCCNDVLGTEATFEARKADFTARQILAELSGLSVNDTTQKHTARIIFGNDRNPQAKFLYTDLSDIFPGYEFDQFAPTGKQKSSYLGEDPSEGGYVYSEPGMYYDVAVLDVASMHPSSIIALNAFGDYTPKFKDLLDARLAIKHENYDAAKKMLNGRLAPYLEDEQQAEALSYALKIVINIVYGLTSAKFDNPFRDPNNIDNMVAKRGALFMIALKKACQDRGMHVVHVKTDSIKIVGASQEDIDFVNDFGRQYDYDFEHEATYEKFCLVNAAVYIAKYGWAAKKKLIGTWQATGAQFQHPVVFKSLFSKEPITWDDQCETKQVMKGSMYLDFESVQSENNGNPNGMQFVGRIGRFVPVTPETGGGILYVVREDKSYAVSGTKGFFWMESSIAQKLGREVEIDSSYFDGVVNEAYEALKKYGDVEAFLDV